MLRSVSAHLDEELLTLRLHTIAMLCGAAADKDKAAHMLLNCADLYQCNQFMGIVDTQKPEISQSRLT